MACDLCLVIMRMKKIAYIISQCPSHILNIYIVIPKWLKFLLWNGSFWRWKNSDVLLMEKWSYHRHHFVINSVPGYLPLCPVFPSVGPMGAPEWFTSPLWEALGIHFSSFGVPLFILGGSFFCSFICSCLHSTARSLSRPWVFSVGHMCTYRHTRVNCESSA